MRDKFDGAAYDRYLLREPDRYWGDEAAEPDDWSLQMEEESIDEARERMTDDERTADLKWKEGRHEDN